MGMRKITPLHVVSFAAAMLTGSCTEPSSFVVDPAVFSDGAANHPITVAPGYRALKIGYGASAEGLSADDSAQLAHFVAEYLAGGNGALSVSVPSGQGSSEALRYFGARIVAMGVPSSRLLVGTHDATANDERVEIGYVAYTAQTAPCGNWSQDGNDTENNLPMPDFGCAVQHNIAAMVADPRDLVTPRDMGPSDAARRATLTKQYETGQTTSAQKTQAQSGAVSQVGGGAQ
jgi:pilus assembly protein CpaD